MARFIRSPTNGRSQSRRFNKNTNVSHSDIGIARDIEERKKNQVEVERQLNILSNLQTHKGSNSSQGEVISNQGYSFVSVGSQGVPAGFKLGTYIEYNPSTNELITKRTEAVRYNRYGFPVQQKTTILKRETLRLDSQEVVNALNSKINSGSFDTKGSTSQEFAQTQRQRLVVEANRRIALLNLSSNERKELAKDPVEKKRLEKLLGKNFANKRQIKASQKTIEAKQFTMDQERRKAINRQLPINQKLTSSEYFKIPATTRLTVSEIVTLAKAGTLKKVINQTNKKNKGYYNQFDKNLVEELGKKENLTTTEQKLLQTAIKRAVKVDPKFSKRANIILDKLNLRAVTISTIGQSLQRKVNQALMNDELDKLSFDEISSILRGTTKVSNKLNDKLDNISYIKFQSKLKIRKTLNEPQMKALYLYTQIKNNPGGLMDLSDMKTLSALKDQSMLLETVKKARVNITYKTSSGKIIIIRSIPNTLKIERIVINKKTGASRKYTMFSHRIFEELVKLKIVELPSKFKSILGRKFDGNVVKLIYWIGKELGAGVAEFYVDLGTGLAKNLIVIIEGLKTTPTALSLLIQQKKIKNESIKIRESIKKNKGKISREDEKRLKDLVKMREQMERTFNKLSSKYDTLKHFYLQEDAKLFRIVGPLIAVTGLVGAVSSSLVASVSPSLTRIGVGVGKIVKYSFRAYGGYTSWVQAYQFLNHPSPRNLGRLTFFVYPTYKGGLLALRRLSPNYMANVRNVKPALKIIEQIKKVHLNYIKVLSGKLKQESVSKVRKSILKDLARSKAEIKSLNHQISSLKSLLKDGRILQSQDFADTIEFKDLKKLLGKKIDLNHVSPEELGKLFGAKGMKQATEQEISKLILSKARGKINEPLPSKIGKLPIKNKFDKALVDLFKKYKIVLGGGTAINLKSKSKFRRSTSDIDAKIGGNKAKRVLTELANKWNKLNGKKLYDVKPGGHPGTYKLINILTKEILVEITNTKNLMKLKPLMNSQGILIESNLASVMGKAGALSTGERFARKGMKDLRDIFRITEGRVTLKIKDIFKKWKDPKDIFRVIEKADLGKDRKKFLENHFYWAVFEVLVGYAGKGSDRVKGNYLKYIIGKITGKINPSILRVEGAELKKPPKYLWDKILKASKLTLKQQNALRREYNTWAKKNKGGILLPPKGSALGRGEKEAISIVDSLLRKYGKRTTYDSTLNKLMNIYLVEAIKNPSIAGKKDISFIKKIIQAYGKDTFKQLKLRLTSKDYLDANIKSIIKKGKNLGKQDMNNLGSRIKKVYSVLVNRTKLELKKLVNDLAKKNIDKQGTLKKIKSLKGILKELGVRVKSNIIKRIKNNLKKKEVKTKTSKTKSKRRTKDEIELEKSKNKLIKLEKELNKSISTRRKATIRQRVKLLRIKIQRVRSRIIKQRKIKRRITNKRKTNKRKRVIRAKTRKVSRKSKRTTKNRSRTTTARTMISRSPTRVTVRKTVRKNRTTRARKQRVTRTPRKTKTPKTPKTPRIPIIPLSVQKERKKKGYGYSVFVKKRRNRRYTAVKNYVLSNAQAINLARYIADNTPIASSKVIPVKKKINKIFKKKVSSQKFRKPKGKSKLGRGTVVEKRKYRIDTAGEKAGITVKGLLSKRGLVKSKSKRKKRLVPKKKKSKAKKRKVKSKVRKTKRKSSKKRKK